MADPLLEGAGTFPGWFPPWARQLAELCFSGTTSAFILHGNTNDLLRRGAAPDDGYGTIADFLAEQMFGKWDLVLHYDLGRGLRAFAGRNEKRLQKMVALANEKIADLSEVKNDPTVVLALLDRFVRANIVSAAKGAVSLAVLIDQASFLFPTGEPGRTSFGVAGMLVTLLSWAKSPHIKKMPMAFVLLDERRADLSERLSGSPHVAPIEVPLPTEAEREGFIRFTLGTRDPATFSDFDAPTLAHLTAGVSLIDLSVLVKFSMETGQRLDATLFRDLKKRLIEKQAQGLLEFIDPKWTLDMVIGHEAAKSRLRQDAQLLRQGRLSSLPMGYLLCGPVGTGKSFLAQCTAGEIGIPCVMLKNFRSKYVGETEGNLERVLSVLRAMGPVMVVIDEADAALGTREAEGDSGTSSRVFGMIATQMGDTRYRGAILWMLLTARPDLLPIDIKRQGRAEVHIPLFYPTEEQEIRAMFVTLAQKMQSRLAPEDLPPIPHIGQLSGADIEGLVGRALRLSLLAGGETITRQALAEAVGQFLPSTQGLEKEMQEVAAVLECTDRQFLPPGISKQLDVDDRGRLQQRFAELRRLIEAV
ncbi:MAG TPA: AAA family ATPase [Gemmatimonadales bacterium]|nr:AAA family ATPase [Gemmatimonadales bacterium]